MGHNDRGEQHTTRSGPLRTAEERTEGGGIDFVSRTLQYEWADILVSASPETSEINWVPGRVGEQWGRVAPDVWSSIREQGFDPHFRHYPTREHFERGELQFELWMESVSADSEAARAIVERVAATTGERLADYVTRTPDAGSWASAEVVTEEPTVVWRTTYQYPSEDDVAYYEALREAIEDHEWVIELVTHAIDDVDR